MPRSFYPDYPPQITDSQKTFLSSTIKEWAMAHGLTIGPPPAFIAPESDPDRALATPAPVTLFPTLFPMQCFHEGLMLQTAFNEMYANIARDEAWLGEVVEELVGIEDFMPKLWDVHMTVKKQGGYAQNLSLGLWRSDYLVHLDPTEANPKPIIRQVEFNTVSVALAGLASRTSSLHKYLLQTAAYPREAAQLIRPDFLPGNSAIESCATGLAKAMAAYGRPKSYAHLQCILFVVQEGDRNTVDQKHLEYALFSYSRIKSFRITMSQILKDTRLDPETRALIYNPPAFPDRTYEVTTVYYRAGYSPHEYTSDEIWEARLHVERSAAIKCPSVLAQLAGSKKVQQILATPDSPHLARFLPFEGIAARVKRTFAPMFPLDRSPAGLEARKLATDPQTAVRYVLKPQREGGGNNIYRGEIPTFLKTIPEDKWAAYILMEMIEPPPQKNLILRNGKIEEGGVISELGVFGTVLYRTGEPAEDEEPGLGPVIENDEAGYLARTKLDTSGEAGVSSGFGAMDSYALIET